MQVLIKHGQNIFMKKKWSYDYLVGGEKITFKVRKMLRNKDILMDGDPYVLSLWKLKIVCWKASLLSLLSKITYENLTKPYLFQRTFRQLKKLMC